MKNIEIGGNSAISPQDLNLAILEADKARAQDAARYIVEFRDWMVRSARNSIGYIQQLSTAHKTQNARSVTRG